MENVTDRVENPFGITPPCEADCSAGVPAVMGYGDANADVHVIGDHPGVHGGAETGVPFTGTEAGRRLQSVLAEVGLLEEGDADRPEVRDCFLSYLHPCCPGGAGSDGADGDGAGSDATEGDGADGDGDPTDADYRRLEPSFDAELRAIAAHVLVPVGDRALSHVLEEYTSRARDLPHDAAALHGREVRGSGFLVVPIREPADWADEDRPAIVERLRATLDSDYRQIADLGHLLGGDQSWTVR